MKSKKTFTIILLSILSLSIFFFLSKNIYKKDNHYLEDNNDDLFISVSKKNNRYLVYNNGTPFIPIGPNICFSRHSYSAETVLKEYEYFFKKMQLNGANYTRVWLDLPMWNTVQNNTETYDFKSLDKLLELAKKYDIKIKFCLYHFRHLRKTKPLFKGSVSMGKDLYNLKHGGSFKNINEYFTSKTGKNLFISKLTSLSKHYKNNTSIWGWELWNEINTVQTANKPDDIYSWTKEMLKTTKKLFPNHIVTQSLGSFDSPRMRNFYMKFSTIEENDVYQVHRYLDPSKNTLPICKSPMDVLASDAINELLKLQKNKPIILSEVGAVLANHAGPSDLYPLDSSGILLHDLLFAPFFTGAAGPGQSWHWTHYIEKHDLWWHFSRFNEAIKNINPIDEEFTPIFSEIDHMRLYTLQGKNTTLIWIRDTSSNWQSELVNQEIAQELINKKIKTNQSGNTSIYDPWKNKWSDSYIENNEIQLPNFRRSLVIQISHQ